MVEVVLSSFGRIPKAFTEFILGVLKDFYSSSSPDRGKPVFVEVFVYGPEYSSSEFLYKEALGEGVEVLGDYLVSHEAWRGWPRIHVDYEKCSKLELEILRALLIHEAAHSVVHGSKDYYLVSLDRGILTLLGHLYGVEAVYVASTAVKDFEVHEYLMESGYRKEVEQYAQYAMREAADLRCTDLLEVLSFAKLVSPCVFVDCSSVLNLLTGSTCGKILEPVLRILGEIGSSGAGLTEKSNALVKSAASILSML